MLKQCIPSKDSTLQRLESKQGFNFAKIGIQAAMKVSHSSDPYEQEAQRIAEEVMRMTAPSLDSETNRQALIGPKCSICETKEKGEQKLNVSRKPSSESSLETDDNVTNEVNSVRSGPASSLDIGTRQFMESRFGYDFGSIIIHTGETAASSAQSVNALAYTLGNDIVFGEGQYQQNTMEGRRLLAHELTHVVQQDRIPHKIQRYEAGEHAQAGSTTRKVTINGVSIDEGDLVAFGDFFEDPKEIYALTKPELQNLVNLTERDKKAYTGVAGIKPVSNSEWIDATKGRPVNKRYLELAKRNVTHFAPSSSGQPGDHKSEWRKWHEQALLKTMESTAAGKAGVPDEAVLINGFAAHFLTDAFSAGHLVNKVDAMRDAEKAWATQNFTGLIFKESDFTRKVAAQVLADPKVAAIMSKKLLKILEWGPVTPQRFSEFIYQMAKKNEKSHFFNTFATLIHNQLNESIKDPSTAVEVTNKKGDPAWMLSGDKTLSKSPDTLKAMQAAVSQSYANLESIAKLGKTPASLEPYFNAVWDYTPILTAAGKKTVDEVVTTFKDPKNPKTVDAFAMLAINEIETVVKELTDEHYMQGIGQAPPAAGVTLPSPPPPVGSK